MSDNPVVQCLETTAECSGPIVRAHAVQNAFVLDQLAEDGHVYMFLHDLDGTIPLKRIGRNKATTFTGYCAHHDASLYREIDLRSAAHREASMYKRLALAGLIAVGVLCSGSAQAQKAVIGGAGPRVGFSSGPDQVVFGGQLIIGEIAPSLTFDPSLDFGFGDNQTVIGLNFDLHYHFAIQSSQWRPYVGAGAGINFVQLDLPPGFNDESQTDVGGNLIVGAGVPTASGNRFFSELKLGLGDAPDLKLMVGWNFKI